MQYFAFFVYMASKMPTFAKKIGLCLNLTSNLAAIIRSQAIHLLALLQPCWSAKYNKKWKEKESESLLWKKRQKITIKKGRPETLVPCRPSAMQLYLSMHAFTGVITSWEGRCNILLFLFTQQKQKMGLGMLLFINC